MKRFTLLICLMLGGCATKMDRVDIPIDMPTKKIVLPKKPILPIRKLTAKNSADEVVKAYVASVELLVGYDKELRKILEAYQG